MRSIYHFGWIMYFDHVDRIWDCIQNFENITTFVDKLIHVKCRWKTQKRATIMQYKNFRQKYIIRYLNLKYLLTSWTVVLQSYISINSPSFGPRITSASIKMNKSYSDILIHDLKRILLKGVPIRWPCRNNWIKRISILT